MTANCPGTFLNGQESWPKGSHDRRQHNILGCQNLFPVIWIDGDEGGRANEVTSGISAAQPYHVNTTQINSAI